MKIATWNLERPKKPKFSSPKNEVILEKLKRLEADVLVLTETNSCIDLGPEYFSCATKELILTEERGYTSGENRVTIWSTKKYGSPRRITTSDESSNICVALQLGHEELLVYGMVIGPYGHPKKYLDKHIEDWERISRLGSPLCIAGDFNISFTGRLKTREGRDKTSACFTKLVIDNLTSRVESSVDHIAISRSFLSKAPDEPEMWNTEKKLHTPRLSDHIGVSVRLNL